MTENTDERRGGGAAGVLSLALLLAGSFAAPVAARAPIGEITRPALLLSTVPDPRSPTGIVIPRDLPAALEELDRILPEAIKEGLRGTEPADASSPSPELSKWILTNWGLWQDSPLARWFQRLGVLSPDDMSGMVLLAYRLRLRGEELALDPLLERFGVRTVAAEALTPVELGSGKKKETAYRFEGWGFAADLPKGMKVRVREKEKDPGGGFTLVCFYAGEGQVLAAYSGGHPSFPSGVPQRTHIRKGTFAGFPAEFAEWKRDGRGYREIKVEIPGDSPAWLHLWYHGLDGAAKKEAERVLSRLKPVRP